MGYLKYTNRDPLKANSMLKKLSNLETLQPLLLMLKVSDNKHPNQPKHFVNTTKDMLVSMVDIFVSFDMESLFTNNQ